MTQNEVDIIKNAVLDATEAYVDARLGFASFVKTQIGVVQSATKNTKGKWEHTVKCNATNATDGIVYRNVLSVNNIHFEKNSAVFVLAPNAQFSNQFILGKLDNVPYEITGGSININDKFIVNNLGSVKCKSTLDCSDLVVREMIQLIPEGQQSAIVEITPSKIGNNYVGIDISGTNLYALSSSGSAYIRPTSIECNGGTIYVRQGAGGSGHYIYCNYTNIISDEKGSVSWTGSDIRYKKNIENLTLDFSKELIFKLQPKEYELKCEKGKRYGFIAQDVRKSLDEMGCKDSRLEYKSNMTKEKMHQLNYSDIIAPLTMCVQDLYKQIDALKAQIEEK